MAMVVARNLWRSFGASPAVAGIDLVVERGSAYGFIGPNGAGKSTTLRMLATVDRPDAGRIWIDGLDAQHRAADVRRRLGFMPDPFTLVDELTVAEYLEFYAIAYRVPPRARRGRVARAVELARIGERLKDRCVALSTGWRQRVHVAKTLVHDPALLLLDEPASGLDPAARIEFREIVRALRDLGKTVIVSSHILSELADFCDSVGIIQSGRMLVSGKIEDILCRLEPADRLELEVVGDPEPARALLTGRSGVRAVELGPPSEEARLLTVHLTGRSTAPERAALLATLLGAGVSVSRLTPRRESLEDLFLKVAGAAGAAPLGRDALRALIGEPKGGPPGEEAAA